MVVGGKAKIIDLGQSCRIGTIKERIQGTPDYIAPEQVHRRPITPRTDVYNLGATMYWTFTRRHIPTALAKDDSLVGSLDDHLIEKPIPAMELNPKIHTRLNELIMQCVEVNPEKRPGTMGVVADRLNLILGILRARGNGKH
jgi:eukaryotic-like serine/threonine-protein kinase